MYEPFESLLNIIDLAGSERRGSSVQQTAPITKVAAPVVNKSQTTAASKKTLVTTKVHNKKAVDTSADILEMESISINKSLTTLGRIFIMIADRKAKNQNPPYRESKLTRILQESLSHECKTLMIVNVCSGSENQQQTKESLNFASQGMLAY